MIQHCPDLVDTLTDLAEAKEPYVCPGGSLVRTGRVEERGESGRHLWYSGKHKTFGGNVQVLTNYPLLVSPVGPGSTQDLTTARAHVLSALHDTAVDQGLRTRPILVRKPQ